MIRRGLPAQTWPVAGLRLLVRLYQLGLRPVLGPNCRFIPSCSDYALDALAAHGALRGSGLAARRVLRCNPWCEGGHDPVPEPPSASAVSPPHEHPPTLKSRAAF
jgi:putative membrane protein insertion efficiency factor